MTSDNGNQVFQVNMEVQAVGGILFRFNFPSNSADVRQTRGENSLGELVESCAEKDCALLQIVGLPFQLQEIANSLDVRVPIEPSEDVSLSSLNFRVAPFRENFGDDVDVEVRYAITFKENTFFEDPINVAIVAGFTLAGVLILAGVCGLLKWRHETNAMASALLHAEEVVRFETRRRRHRMRTASSIANQREPSQNEEALSLDV